MKLLDQKYKIKFWTDEFLGKELSADTETELIESESHVPRLAVTTAYGSGDTGYVIKNQDLESFLKIHEDTIICWHNASFDLKVIEQHLNMSFHSRIERRKVLDTRILFRLLHIAVRGFAQRRSSLAHCFKERFKEELDKDKSIRLTFGEYINDDGSVRYDDIPEQHYEYAVKDSIATQMLRVRMMKKMQSLPTSTNLSHDIQLKGEIALDDIKRRGIQVDLEYTDKLRNDLETEIDRNANILITYGLVKGRGFQQKYESVIKHLGLIVPVTPKTKKMSMKAEDLEKYRGNHFVDALLVYIDLKKLKDFLNLLVTDRVHPRYNSIMNTLRTSCSKPNIQNPPRKGGIREAFIPAPGKIFIDLDYSSIELYALAYICKKDFGHSVLYDKLQAGDDIHVYAASKIYDKKVEDVTKEERQVAKIANYGLAANMGNDTFSRHMGSSGLDFTPEEAGEVKKAWVKAFPEMRNFWKKAQGRVKIITDTGFIRNNCSYTAYLNTQFQSKVAEGCKIMLYNLHVMGFDTVAFVHDQVVIEADKDKADGLMKQAEQIMVDSMKVIIPGMNIEVEGELKDRYSK